ncbi:MAG: hypothetical protein MI922_29580, partial [Bacteroidales bacterium]|nr:hypothetical protein [Bacteroidales bacterium]
MTHLYNRIFVMLILNLFIINIYSQTSKIFFKNSKPNFQTEQTSPQRFVRDNGSEGLVIEYVFDGAVVGDQPHNGVRYKTISIPGFGMTEEIGKPMLPAKNELIALPSSVHPIISIIDFETETLDELYDIHPALAPARDTEGNDEQEFVLDSETYQTNAFYPANVSKVIDVQKLRGQPFAIVQFRPVQYNPVTKKVKVFTRLKLEIKFSAMDAFRVKSLDVDSRYQSYLRSFVLNGDMVTDLQKNYRTTG